MGEEFDEAKAKIEKLKADLKLKTDLADNLRKAHGEQLIRTQEACSKIETLARELNGKEEEISKAKRMCEDFQSSLHEKESVIRRLSIANDKLRVASSEKYKKWERFKVAEEADRRLENEGRDRGPGGLTEIENKNAGGWFVFIAVKRVIRNNNW